MYPCELVGGSKYLSPLRVLDSQGWPNLGRDLPLEYEHLFTSQIHLSDFCVPMLSLCASVRDGLRRVRCGPEIHYKPFFVEHPYDQQSQRKSFN